MNLLLDTHAFLWFISGDAQLADYARQLIEDSSNRRYLSIASVWEITIKSSLGRLEVPGPPSKLISDYVWANAIELLSITSQHLDVAHGLPYHHKDPFDRLMIAQAMHEGLTLISKDRTLTAYNLPIEWVGY